MTDRLATKIAAMATLFVLSFTAAASAQVSSGTAFPANPRSTNERIVTEDPAPRTIQNQVNDAEAAGELRRRTEQAADRAAAIQGERNNQVVQDVRAQAAIAANGEIRDLNNLIGHSVGMAIESCSLKDLSEMNKGAKTDPNKGIDAPKELMMHSKRSLQAGERLLKAAADSGRNIDGNSPTRRYYNAANAFVSTLAALDGRNAADRADTRAGKNLDSNEKASIALINHAVHEAIEASMIRQMARMSGAPSAASEQLLGHAREMSTEGTQTVMRFLGNAPRVAPSNPNNAEQAMASVQTLAQRARELIDVVDTLDNQPVNVRTAVPAVPVQPGRVAPVVPVQPGRVAPVPTIPIR